MFLEGAKDRLSGCSLLENNTYDQLIHSFQIADYDELSIGLTDLISQFSITIPINLDVMLIEYNITNDMFIANDLYRDDGYANIKSWQLHSMDGWKYIKAYVSARRSHHKCFTIDLPMVQGIQIRQVQIRLNTSGSFSTPDRFSIYLTYPNQLISTLIRGKEQLSGKGTNTFEQLRYTIKVGPMKVFKRRDKRGERCNENWKTHDEMHLNHIIEKVGCNPTYWKLASTSPNCSTPEQLFDIIEALHTEASYMTPCRSIVQIQKSIDGFSPCRWACQGDPYIDLIFYLDRETYYEEILLSPSYTFQSLVGNAGIMD